jgi:hypothetical protein
MTARAHTPEELETLFEDTFLVRDRNARAGIDVVRRGNDGSWRYAISFLDIDQASVRKQP